ncbi:MAG TPA: VanZ family protein [Mobilitalea sp.]|nr:VanZ family protein [Mobilitalea sp.]
MLDYGSRIDDYSSFFRNNSIIFVIFYIVLLAYAAISKDAFPWAYSAASASINFTPFWTLSSHIEDYLYGQLPMSDIVIYLCTRILIFLPYGFYCTLLLHKKSRILRFLTLFLLPLLIEVLQYFIIPSRCDIDDFIFGVIGGIIGSLGFYLTNAIFHAISGKYFLAKETGYHFSHSSLHF